MYFSSNFSLQNYKIGPKKNQNYLTKLEIKTEQNFEKNFFIEKFLTWNLPNIALWKIMLKSNKIRIVHYFEKKLC